ncbi:hypothetical protein KSP39_PZI016081 [Platanthera zijinensis]|uniref:Uncharacterized protein n=1 Tax=Platanthera zijinensis TaxID=2320716 RepID=A0AAP0B651_9ASPA
MTNEADPNFIGYVKHLTAQLLMDNDMLQLPFPEFKTEKLKTIVDDSVDFLMRETDRVQFAWKYWLILVSFCIFLITVKFSPG